MEVSMKEYTNRIASLGSPVTAEVGADGSTVENSQKKRSRALATADILIVNVMAQSNIDALDATVSSAVENPNISSVILTSIRSSDEAKLVRNLLMKEKSSSNTKPISGSHRRLQEDKNDDQADFAYGVYFVSMTPNIFSGILFFLFFTFVAYIGISVMGMISGQDVYCQKYPSIGREA